MKELVIKARIENIPQIISFVEEYLQDHGCMKKTQMQFDIAIDEIASNIARYAYEKNQPGEISVTIDVDTTEKIITMVFSDSGIPFDPLNVPSPDTLISSEERTPGGLGIYMVKKSMDEMTYDYINNKNVLTLRKKY